MLADTAAEEALDQATDGRVTLAILLVNYNGVRYLPPCLESIARFAPPGTKVILEDNASTDDSVAWVARHCPWVQILRSESNLGFAGGNNLAGREAHGEFLLLLNTDTELLEPIAPVVDWLREHKAYGTVTINMVDGDRVPRACTGRFPSALRLALLRRMLVAPVRYRAAEAYDVDWVQGSFLLIRADLWRRLGGLDDEYFMYAEDVDLCKRVQDAGWKCGFIPGTTYLHWGGFDPGRFPDQVRGLARYVDKHKRGFQRGLCRAVLFAGCVSRVVFYKMKGLVLNRRLDRTKAEGSWRAVLALSKNPIRGK